MHSASWVVPGAATSAARCRAEARTCLHEWGLEQADVLQDVQLVLTELVGNAVRHTASAQLVVGLRCDPQTSTLTVEVTDQSPRGPRPRRAPADAEDGRGMELVSALTSEHGWSPHGGGKTVWARLALG